MYPLDYCSSVATYVVCRIKVCNLTKNSDCTVTGNFSYAIVIERVGVLFALYSTRSEAKRGIEHASKPSALVSRPHSSAL